MYTPGQGPMDQNQYPTPKMRGGMAGGSPWGMKQKFGQQPGGMGGGGMTRPMGGGFWGGYPGYGGPDTAPGATRPPQGTDPYTPGMSTGGPRPMVGGPRPGMGGPNPTPGGPGPVGGGQGGLGGPLPPIGGPSGPPGPVGGGMGGGMSQPSWWEALMGMPFNRTMTQLPQQPNAMWKGGNYNPGSPQNFGPPQQMQPPPAGFMAPGPTTASSMYTKPYWY